MIRCARYFSDSIWASTLLLIFPKKSSDEALLASSVQSYTSACHLVKNTLKSQVCSEGLVFDYFIFSTVRVM